MNTQDEEGSSPFFRRPMSTCKTMAPTYSSPQAKTTKMNPGNTMFMMSDYSKQIDVFTQVYFFFFT